MSESHPASVLRDASLIYRILGWCITLLTPVVLVLSAVRLLLVPAFLEFEYRTPNFPPDRYGFTLEERLYWSKIALEYLLNDAGIEFLGNLRFEDGSPVYNARELRHMVDVKVALGGALAVWRLSLAAMLILFVWAWRGRWLDLYWRGLRRGGWLTLLIVIAVLLAVALSFGVFFVAFHNVFFAPGTWMFAYEDTLIRLFPERFWRDVFIYIGGIAALFGLALLLGLRRK